LLGPVGGIIGGFAASAITGRTIKAAEDRSKHKKLKKQRPQLEPGSSK
jgi:hypothetical protein